MNKSLCLPFTGVGGYCEVSQHRSNQPLANNSFIVSKSCGHAERFKFYCCSNRSSVSGSLLIGPQSSDMDYHYSDYILRYYTTSDYCKVYRSYNRYGYCYSSYYFSSSHQGVYTCRMKDSNNIYQDFSMGIYPHGFNSKHDRLYS